jgi:hypothetical protein
MNALHEGVSRAPKRSDYERMSCQAFPRWDRRRGMPSATDEHMPFFAHRSAAEVREEEARNEILRSLGR